MMRVQATGRAKERNKHTGIMLQTGGQLNKRALKERPIQGVQ